MGNQAGLTGNKPNLSIIRTHFSIKPIFFYNNPNIL